MKGGRYSVDVEFTAQVEPGRTMGRNVSKLESYLPKGATMRLVKADPDKGVIEVEVCLSAASPAMALRDVSRAIELVAVTPAGVPADDRIGGLLQAKVTRIGDDPAYSRPQALASIPVLVGGPTDRHEP